MSRRRSIRKKKKQEKPLPPVNPMSMERTMHDIHRLLDEQDFENEDEINAFMNNLMKSGPIPHHQAETDLERAQELMYEAWEVGGPLGNQYGQKSAEDQSRLHRCLCALGGGRCQRHYRSPRFVSKGR